MVTTACGELWTMARRKVSAANLSTAAVELARALSSQVCVQILRMTRLRYVALEIRLSDVSMKLISSPSAPGCLALGNPVHVLRCRRREPQRRRHQRRDHHLADHCRAALLARLCSIPVLVAQTPRWLPAGSAFSARLCSGSQSSGFFDRNSGNRQNFRRRRSVCIHRCIRADGHCLRARFRLELSEQGYKVCKHGTS